MDFKNMFNIPKEPIIPNIELDLRDPDEVTNKILNFLQAQSRIAERQFKTSINLIIATIIIMLLQIFVAFFTITLTADKKNTLAKVIEGQSQQSETISSMSLSLLDLQNQVNSLEKEKKELMEKLNSE